MTGGNNLGNGFWNSRAILTDFNLRNERKNQVCPEIRRTPHAIRQPCRDDPCSAIPPSGQGGPGSLSSPLFVAGEKGYHTYHIPALIVSSKGTLLAFCEGRKKSTSDAGDIDLLLRRSLDGGLTWKPTQVVWDDGKNTCGNPCPVIDTKTGAIVALLTHNLGSDSEAMILAGKSKGTRTVWVTESSDDGISWSKPVEIGRAGEHGRMGVRTVETRRRGQLRGAP